MTAPDRSYELEKLAPIYFISFLFVSVIEKILSAGKICFSHLKYSFCRPPGLRYPT
jgi:hypothetical protein